MSFGALVHALQHVKVLKAHQLIVIRLADHATDSGLSWPSHSLLARETGYTREYVIRVMHDLVTEGVVNEVFDAKGRRRYQLPVYDIKHRCCSCEQSPAECELSSQLLVSACELSFESVNSAACKSSHSNENATEPLTEEPKKICAHAHEVSETDDHRRREPSIEPRMEARLWDNDADMQAVHHLVAQFLNEPQRAQEREHHTHRRSHLSRGYGHAMVPREHLLAERLVLLRQQALTLDNPEMHNPFWCDAHSFAHGERLPDHHPDCWVEASDHARGTWPEDTP